MKYFYIKELIIWLGLPVLTGLKPIWVQGIFRGLGQYWYFLND
jgi:hypothetical protein